jgi:hypothetical protein
MKLAQPASLY